MLRRTISPALVALVLALLVALGASAQTQGDGRIAFNHRTTADGVGTVDIVTIEPDGSDPRQLTDTPKGGFNGYPSWTRNGKILFTSDRTDGFPHLFEMNANGHGVEQLTSGTSFDCCPSMSPDGRLIAFNGADCGFCPGGSFPTQGIFLVGPKGGEFDSWRRVTLFPGPDPDGADDQPDFSPEGSRIAFVRQAVTRNTGPMALSAVFVVNVDGTGLEQLTPYSLDAESPHWSPDGTSIVFDSNADNPGLSNNLYLVSAEGGPLTQLTHEANGNDAFHPDWSPDATKLVFVHHTVGESRTDLDVMDAHGGGVTTILHGADGTFDSHPSWGTRP